ncbi:MAG: RNA polymerase sigma factor [Planctomycetota bacterium]|jgi:RNA polymerase sigma-70 factor (ECF subfamily)
MGTTDKHYIERCLDGHPDDFRYLVRRYQVPLLAHLAGQLGNRDKAEEAAQEALVRAYFSLEKLKKRGSFFSWLLGIASHVAKEQQRSEQRRRHIAETLSERAPDSELSQDYALEKAVTALPESYRQIVLLRYYGGRSCSQVAEQLRMPLGTVTKTLSRAYVMLRESLQQQNEDCEVQK